LSGGGEDALLRAYELGRHALVQGGGVLEMAALHQEALVTALLEMLAPVDSRRIARRASEFFAEALAAFEMSQRGVAEANAILRDNRELRERVEQVLGQYRAARRTLDEQLRVDRLKDDFISIVSHELRTPLTSIHASLRLMQQGMGGALAPEARHLVDVAARNSQRLVRLVDEILDLRKIEAGLALERQPVDLRPLLEQALEANRSYAEQCGVRFVLQGEAGPAMVLGDAERLMQVLANLLSNAAKYSPAGEAIVVAAERCEDAIRVSVRDRGPGIPPEFRSRIFQKFAQADTSTSREKGGTGLGLSISKAIVERLGGRIDFDSDPGRATTFYFELPEHRPE
jgi:signal transduction histidine kinase